MQIELLTELIISRMVPQQDTKDYEIKTPATKHQNSRSNALFAFQEEVPPRKGGIMKPIVEDGKTSNTQSVIRLLHLNVSLSMFNIFQRCQLKSSRDQMAGITRGGVGALAKTCHHMSHPVLILSEDHHHHQHYCSIHLGTQYVK